MWTCGQFLKSSSGSDGAESDVAVFDGGGRVAGFNVGGNAGGSWARAAGDSGNAGIGIGGEVGVEPQHVDVVVIPQAHDQDHALLHGVAQRLQTSFDRMVVDIAEQLLSGDAHLFGDGVEGGEAWEVGLPKPATTKTIRNCIKLLLRSQRKELYLGVFDFHAILDVETAHFNEVSVGCAVGCQELGDDGDGFRRVHRKVSSRSVVSLVSHTVVAEVAAILVANAVVTAKLTNAHVAVSRHSFKFGSMIVTGHHWHCRHNRFRYRVHIDQRCTDG